MLVNPLTKNRIAHFLDKPAHAVAIIAPEGAGKGFIAQYLAQQLLGVADAHDHPYVLHIDTRQQNAGIDEVRDIQKFLALTVPGKKQVKRVVIIEGADYLKHEAQNALLKTLEEPPTDTVIIITYSNEQLVLQTIRSRVSILPILPISIEQARTELNVDEATLTRAYHISSGYVGLLWVLAHNGTGHPLGAAIAEARTIISMSRYERLSKVDQFAKSKTIEPRLLIDGLYRLLNAGYHQALHTKTQAELKPMAHRLRLIELALRDLQSNVQTKIVLSRLFMEL